MKFAPLIRDARRRSLLSHDELASAVGVSPKAIWRAEKGSGTLKTLNPILKHLPIPIAELPPASSLGERVHQARKKKGWSLQKLSERCGLSIPTIRNLEGGGGHINSLEAVIAALAPAPRLRRPTKIRRATPNGVVHSPVQSLVNANCLEFMQTVETGAVSLVVTSPPYNADKEYETALTVEEYEEFADSWVSCLPRLLRPNGAVWLNVGYMKISEAETLPLTYLYYPILKKHKLKLVQEIVWHFEGGEAYTKRFSHRTERWMWCVKDAKDHVFHLDAVRDGTLNRTKDQRNNAFGKNPTDYWYFDAVRGGRGATKEKTVHPCQFPVEMIERIVRACTNPGDTILDCFGGSGTSAVAAFQNGRGFISIESNNLYHEAAKARLDRIRRQNGMVSPPAF